MMFDALKFDKTLLRDIYISYIPIKPYIYNYQERQMNRAKTSGCGSINGRSLPLAAAHNQVPGC